MHWLISVWILGEPLGKCCYAENAGIESLHPDGRWLKRAVRVCCCCYVCSIRVKSVPRTHLCYGYLFVLRQKEPPEKLFCQHNSVCTGFSLSIPLPLCSRCNLRPTTEHLSMLAACARAHQDRSTDLLLRALYRPIEPTSSTSRPDNDKRCYFTVSLCGSFSV